MVATTTMTTTTTVRAKSGTIGPSVATEPSAIFPEANASERTGELAEAITRVLGNVAGATRDRAARNPVRARATGRLSTNAGSPTAANTEATVAPAVVTAVVAAASLEEATRAEAIPAARADNTVLPAKAATTA